MKKMISQATLIHMIVTCGLLGYTNMSFAHEGDLHVHTFVSGMVHPLLGLDHLAALALTGIWATVLVKDQRSVWLPVTFLVAMSTGLIAGGLGWTFSAMSADTAVLFALMGMPVLLLLRAPLSMSLMLMSVAGIVHGNAHTGNANQVAMGGWLAGLMLMSAALHMTGWRIGMALSSQRWFQGCLGVMTVAVSAGLISGV